MADTGKRVIVDGVEFGQVFLFPRILSAMTAAMQPGRLVIALFMVVLLITAGRIWDAMTEPLVPPEGVATGRFYDYPGVHQEVLAAALFAFAPERIDTREGGARFKTTQVIEWVDEGYRKQRAAITGDDAAARAQRTELDERYVAVRERIENTRPRGDFEATMEHAGRSFQVMRDGVLNLSARQTLAGARMLLVDLPVGLWNYQTWFAIVYGLVFLIVFAVGGGAISRMAAVQQAKQQRLGVREATDFALSRWGGLIWAQALPVLLMGVLAGVIVAAGFLLMRWPVLDVITAIAYGLILILGFLIAFLLVGYAVGFPLLAPAVACENCDGADAMQRTYAYVVNRPLHILWYWAVALLGLALGFLLVSLIAVITLNASANLLAQWADHPALESAGGYRMDGMDQGVTTRPVVGNWHERWAGNILGFWETVVVCLVVAYVFSYHFSAATIVYLLMRKASDGQEMDEIWRPGLIPGTLAPAPPPVGQVQANPEP